MVSCERKLRLNGSKLRLSAPPLPPLWAKPFVNSERPVNSSRIAALASAIGKWWKRRRRRQLRLVPSGGRRRPDAGAISSIVALAVVPHLRLDPAPVTTLATFVTSRLRFATGAVAASAPGAVTTTVARHAPERRADYHPG